MISTEDFGQFAMLPLFKGADEIELSFYANKFDFQTYVEDEIILNGSAFEDKNCYFICSGRVRVVKAVPTNTEVSYYDLEAPMGFGLGNALLANMDAPEHTVIVSAITQVGLFSIRQNDCDTLLTENPKLLLNFTHFLISMHHNLSLPSERLMNHFRKTA